MSDNISGNSTKIGNENKKFICYWLKSVEQEFLVIIGVTIVMLLYAFLSSTNKSIADILKMYPIALVGTGTFMVAAYTIVNSNQLVNIAVSMGSTRKEAFFSQISTLLILSVQLLIVYAITAGAAGEIFNEMPINMGIVFAGLLVTMIGIGQIGMGIYRKYGSRMVAVYVIAIGAVVFGIVFMGVSMCSTISEMISAVKITAPVLGIVIFVLGGIINYSNLQKIEVKW